MFRTVGQTIRALRKKRGLTQKQLGDLCGLSGVAVCEYEQGKTMPKRQVIEKFAGALGVPVSEITGETAPPRQGGANTTALLDGSLGALKILCGSVEGKTLLDGSGGRAFKDNRLTLNGILYWMHTGVPWRDLPKRYGRYRCVYDRLWLWNDTGVWPRVLARMLETGIVEESSIVVDSMHFKETK